MLGRRLFAYFDHWSRVNQHYKVTMQTRVKDKIVKMYVNYLGSYFTHWKQSGRSKVQGKRKKIMDTMAMENERMQNEALEGEKNLRV